MKQNLSGKKAVLDTCFIAALFREDNQYHTIANRVFQDMTDQSVSVQIIIPTIVLSEVSCLGLSQDTINNLISAGCLQVKAYTSAMSFDTKTIMDILEVPGRSAYKKDSEAKGSNRKWDEFTDDIKIIATAKNTGADFILTFDKDFIRNSQELQAAGYYDTIAIDISTNEGLADLNGGQVPISRDI